MVAWEIKETVVWRGRCGGPEHLGSQSRHSHKKMDEMWGVMGLQGVGGWWGVGGGVLFAEIFFG